MYINPFYLKVFKEICINVISLPNHLNVKIIERQKLDVIWEVS